MARYQANARYQYGYKAEPLSSFPGEEHHSAAKSILAPLPPEQAQRGFK
jgi:hypothetical protein